MKIKTTNGKKFILKKNHFAFNNNQIKRSIINQKKAFPLSEKAFLILLDFFTIFVNKVVF